jgi:hypothetical protein
MKTIIKENTWLTRGMMDFGWGNGYVLIPKGHPMHGVHYDSINVDVHYGLTFSELASKCVQEMFEGYEMTEQDMECWIVGFDTCHYDDTLEKWPKEEVQAETNRLREQLEAIAN